MQQTFGNVNHASSSSSSSSTLTASASANLTAIAMQRDTLKSIFVFAELTTLMSYSQVCRIWQSTAHSMPLLKAIRQASLLNNKQLAQLAKAMEDLAQMRKANDPLLLKHMISTAEQTLRRESCMAVAGPLLDALKSVQVIRKQLRKLTWEGEPGDLWISIKLPSTKSTTATSAKHSFESVTLHMSWLLDAEADDDASECSWEIGLGETKAGKYGETSGESRIDGGRQLFFVYQQIPKDENSGEAGIWSSETKKLVEWMRNGGLMGEGASPRQQFELAHCALRAIFQIAGETPDLDYIHSLQAATIYTPEVKWPPEHAAAAVAARKELPEPPLSFEEQQDELKPKEQLEERESLALNDPLQMEEEEKEEEGEEAEGDNGNNNGNYDNVILRKPKRRKGQ